MFLQGFSGGVLLDLICFYGRQCVRVVKESDSKSDGLCPRGFESPRCRCCFLMLDSHTLISMLRRQLSEPNIAQLVERSTVGGAGIEWSLVRFRVFGFFFIVL